MSSEYSNSEPIKLSKSSYTILCHKINIYISYKNPKESKQDCSNIYAIKKENYQERVKDFISTTFLIP